jgi:hypothetical protein
MIETTSGMPKGEREVGGAAQSQKWLRHFVPGRDQARPGTKAAGIAGRIAGRGPGYGPTVILPNKPLA